MINVSDLFKQKLEEGESVWQLVEITFPDGTVKTVQDEIMSGNNSFSDCAESSSFPIGCVICKSMSLELDNTSDQWKNYNFYMAKVHAYLKMQTQVATPAVTDELLDEDYNPILDQSGDTIIVTKAAVEDKVETIDKGTYTITTPEQYGEILSFTALDDMYKTNAPYTSNLVLPQTVMNLVRDACDTLDIPMGFSSMTHGSLIVNEIPDNMTFRQLFGWAAMLETANARLDNRGYLQLAKWNFSAEPIELKDYIDMPTVSSDDIVITGIRVKNSDNSELYGESGYVLDLENNLVGESDLATVAAQIGDAIIGVRFRNLQGDMAYNPLLEFGDMACTYDRNMNKYLTPLTDVSTTVNGSTTVKTQADDPIRGMSSFVSDGTKAIVEARRLVKIEQNEREKAVKRLADILSSSGGLYMTEEPQEDGSSIYYMHNKPILNESDIIWKLTAEAFAVSIDGGKTYPYGFAVTGELITRLLYAEGINATYINAGTFVVKDKNGKIIFMADMDSGSVRIDASYVQIGGSALDEALDNMQGQIDGNIETWTGADAPTLDNYPAKNWLTDDERSKHVGDVYYDSKNQGYRFRNDGSGYGWQMVKDTDITKALQDAAEAKESAANAEKAASLARNMTLQLSNDMQTITADSDGNIPNFPTVSTRATVMYGTQDITSDCSFAVTKSDSVIGSWSDATHVYNVTALSADNGWVDIKATYLNSLSVTKRFTLSKQKTGKTGDTGKGIKGTPKSQYQVSTSGTTAPTGTWLDTVPETKEGQFLWTKTVTEYTDGTSTTGYSVAYIGKNGANGTDGNGVISTEVAYQASDNGTTPPTGEWSATPPSAKEGQYIWTRVVTKYSKSDPVTAYSVGKIGESGKQLYTWRKYASMPDGSDMTDSPDYVKLLDSAGSPILDSTGAEIYTITEAIYVGIADNKTTETPSDNPIDYIWSRFRGEDGADGIGIPGENGETSYIHTAYANSIDGTVDFSTTDTDRIYIGHYSDFEKADSTDPKKYTWARMRGEDGVPGRTYMIEPSCNVLKRGANKVISPNFLEFKSYYRDGNEAERHPYSGRFVIEETSDGETWTTIYTSSSDESSVKHYLCTILTDGNAQTVTDGNGTTIGIPRDVTNIRCRLYESGGTTNQYDMQSVAVVIDVDALTQEQIVEILSGDGEFKGLYYVNGHLYISLDALMGNAAILGGAKNGNGYLKIKNENGSVKGLVDYSGYTVFTSYEEDSDHMKYTGVQFSSEGIFPVDVEKFFGDEVDVEIVNDSWGISWDDENLKIDATEVSANTGEFSNLTAKNCDLEISTMKASGSCIFDANSTPDFQNSLSVKNFSYTTAGWNAWISNSNYKICAYGSSSERYKVLGDSLTEEFIESLYNIEPIMARYKDGYLIEHDERVGVEFPMFRAEDVDTYFPLAVDHINGKAENWNERIMIPAMFAMLKAQKKKIDQQEKLINRLYEHLNLKKEI